MATSHAGKAIEQSAVFAQMLPQVCALEQDGVAIGQSALVRQSTHVWPTASHFWPLRQSVEARHSTQTPAATSQTDLRPQSAVVLHVVWRPVPASPMLRPPSRPLPPVPLAPAEPDEPPVPAVPVCVPELPALPEPFWPADPVGDIWSLDASLWLVGLFDEPHPPPTPARPTSATTTKSEVARFFIALSSCRAQQLPSSEGLSWPDTERYSPPVSVSFKRREADPGGPGLKVQVASKPRPRT